MQQLAQANTDNAGWQRDLAVSYAKLAGVYLKLKETAQAQDALAAGRSVIAALIARHPDSQQWNQDLGYFDRQIAALNQ
jgi:hypothetical protein